MKKYLLLTTAVLMLSAAPAMADKAPEWCNPQINQQNRVARHANFFAFENEE